MKNTLLTTIMGALMLSTVSTVRGSVIVTYAENASQEVSSLSGTSVYDFNSLSLGRNTNVSWNNVGTFDQLYIKNPDQYGGATDSTHSGGTKYSVQGVGTSVSSSTLSLNQNSGYFGLWWSAGDASNVLDFYQNDSLVGEFKTNTLLTALGSSYKGNPRNRSLDSGEPFAFINFYGDANTTWNKIVFRNATSSGFESDNYTSRTSTYNQATDGTGSLGASLARVTGTTTTTLSPSASGAALWGSAGAVPGAPAPPLPLIAAFATALLMKARKGASKRKNGQDFAVSA